MMNQTSLVDHFVEFGLAHLNDSPSGPRLTYRAVVCNFVRPYCIVTPVLYTIASREPLSIRDLVVPTAHHPTRLQRTNRVKGLAMELKVLTLNLHTYQEHRGDLWHVLQEHEREVHLIANAIVRENIDVVCFQEVGEHFHDHITRPYGAFYKPRQRRLASRHL